MTKYQDKYRVESCRLKNWDYSADGYYFVTICVENGGHCFGQVKDFKMYLSEIGAVVKNEWLKTGEIRKNVILDEFVIMPNHIHTIIIINSNNKPIDKITFRDEVESLWDMNTPASIINLAKTPCRDEAAPRLYNEVGDKLKRISPKPNSLSSILGSFKSACTKKIRTLGYDFEWQERFYDNVIRNEEALYRIRQYIIENPEKWERDRNNPKGLFI
ncbi:MAG: hypothetical protein A2663_01720 [Candidatus Buchananbacteria bacterium RIFCSPHIGHO2_01_FULL_46_12]|uniref:Transposase IS200-like domain-containing protein n=3 Tax=Candidatus Buchananiibacteriota TaxID=1817903 RepID=A0A1G1YPB4_9BACT|nr:MAG: hypothetical protein A2663_01720 [Candidatus Buchananbacteria bacterium RIFCSPHIGHO2_01_FULL_46_12]OGY54203.1 MAG: hypothetical protein A3B15_01305 [Candidatus Buchananbacteria bacterium RIFCSPLOWO2_01_FULL_45_31]OGY56663.1 MAG: hypothetical protein A3H67_00505 [Candidatus Buchananbacteria bacterium RIFCSPLOWO2_02_FULL_46_11b]